MSFADVFYMSFTLEHDLENITSSKLPIHMITGRKYLFDVFTKTTTAKENRLRIDLKTVKNAYDSFEVNYVALKRTKLNISYALSKVKTNSVLLHTIKNGKIDHPTGQWIILTKANEFLVDTKAEV